MDPSLNKRSFVINSANRLAGSSSAFSFFLNIPASEHYDCIVVTQASIPVSYYLVPIGGNTFTLQEGEQQVTISITPANYNLNSFVTQVQTLLNLNSPNGWTYSMSYTNSFTTPQTGLITYTVSGNSSQPSFIFGDNYLNEQFGFNYASTASFNGNSLISSNVVNFVNENVVLIHSDLVDNGDNDLLQDIYGSTTQSLGIITYQCPQLQEYSKKLKIGVTTTINLYLTDDNNVPLNMNGINWDCTILLYKKSNFKDIILGFIQWITQIFQSQLTEE